MKFALLLQVVVIFTGIDFIAGLSELPPCPSDKKNGDEWLDKYCNSRMRCENGTMHYFSHECPAFSECVGGQCDCKEGYLTLERTDSGLLRSCTKPRPPEAPCKRGFNRILGLCLYFKRHGKLNHLKARDICMRKGGRLLVSRNIFSLVQKIREDKSLRDQKYMIMGAPELIEKEMDDYQSSGIKMFVMNVMKRYNVGENIRYQAFRRFSGDATTEDLNFMSPLSHLCLVITEDGPELVKCSSRFAIICEEALDDGIFWTSWYNVMKPDKNGEKESLIQILQKYNHEYSGKQDRLCLRPIAMECRQPGSKTLYSSKDTHGLVLKYACEKLRIQCIHKDQTLKIFCPDFEVRFKCPKYDESDCRVDMIKKHCDNQGKVCVNRRTGPVCVKPRRRKDKKNKIFANTCVKNSIKYDMHLCSATGDPHYRTLDGYIFHYQGICSYDFMYTCNRFHPTENFPVFKIVTTNYKRVAYAKPSWTKSFAFTLEDNTYTFTQGSFFINGIKVNPIGYSDDHIKIVAKCMGKTNVLTILTNFCLWISWDNRHGLHVYVPDVYKKHICGLCGNYDGNPKNDLMLSTSNKPMTSAEISQYYTAPSLDDKVCPMIVVDPTPCDKSDRARLGIPQACGVLDVNGNSPLVKAIRDGADSSSWPNNMAVLEQYFDQCVLDLCWDPSTDRCHDLEEVIDKIHKSLVILDAYLDNKWRQFASCEKTDETRCDDKPNMVYSRHCRPACEDTCAEPGNSQICEDENEEPGCVCKEGYYMDTTMNCVPIEECERSCRVELDTGETFSLKNGEEFVEVPCERILKCVDGKLEEKLLESCSVHADCTKEGRVCRCREGFIGDGVICTTDRSCRPGYTAVGDLCYKFIQRKMTWHSCAIRCGYEGSVLARYDDAVNEELVTFFEKIPLFYVRSRAVTKYIYCKVGSACNLPKHFIGLSLRLKNRADFEKCRGKYHFAQDKKTIVTKNKCEGMFVVKMYRESLYKMAEAFRVWIGGNSYVVDQSERGSKAPIQIDPPRMLDLSVFSSPKGCFQANLNQDGNLIVTPNPKCDHKKPCICEYDNIGLIPHDPNDFKRLKEKGNREEAIEMCKRVDRPLASIYNNGQNQRVRNLLAQLNGDGWIGAIYSQDSFVWGDNKPLSFKNWREAEPNNYANNPRSDEQCVAMDKAKGRWFTDDCSEENYPICGPPFHMEPAAYTKFYQVKGFKSLNELRQMLGRSGSPDYVCRHPISIECSSRDDNFGPWRTNHNQQGKVMECNNNRFICRPGLGLDCDTFRVRFMCSSEVNICELFKNESISPCTGGRICIPVRNHYMCKCPRGTMWDPKQKACQVPCGICYARGDPHYRTFSGQYYNFMGTCMYKFTGVCNLKDFKDTPNFDIYTKNRPCGNRGASCLDIVEIHLRNIPYSKNGNRLVGNFVFRLGMGRRYFMNGVQYSTGEMIVPGAFKVVRRLNYFNLIVHPLSLNVLRSRSNLQVNLPNNFIGKMCGLCGDCNTDQFRKKDGSLVSIAGSARKRLDPNEMITVANEWIVPYDGSDPDVCIAVKPLNECADDKTLELMGPTMCGIFRDPNSVVKDCFSAVNPEKFYEDCMVDACHDNATESVCSTVRVYVQTCMEKMDIILAWRSPDFCPMDCKDKMYRADASCEPMCGRDFASASVCDEKPEEGCVCPDGFMRQGNDCVAPEKCGCEVLIGDDETVFIPLGESRLLPRCEEISTCGVTDDGESEEVREMISLDANAICVENPDPRIECAGGFSLQPDNRTCIRDPDACSDDYLNKGDLCIRIPRISKIWRQAVQVCNQQDGTLVRVDTADKLESIRKIMKMHNYEEVYISGQVEVSLGPTDIPIISPVLSIKQQGKIEYYNYDYKDPSVLPIQLSDNLEPGELRKGPLTLALVVRLGPDDGPSIIAVKRDTQTNFICEERDVMIQDEEWYGPCNSDTNMADHGDEETKNSLNNIKGCLVCPHPMDVKCTHANTSTGFGTVVGDCRITKSGTYYLCDQGNDCIDTQVSTKCARDVDDCKERLHDCPAMSNCKNTIGAYICVCDIKAPLMIKGYCHAKKECGMVGPKTANDYDYRWNGFSNVPGFLPYSCPIKIFETCRSKYDIASSMPLLSIYEYTQRKGDKMIQVVGGWISNPSNRATIHFSVYDQLLRQGKFMYGKSADSMVETDLGFGCLSMRASFSFIPPGIMVVHHFDNIFRFVVTFPVNLWIMVSSSYADMACGMCTIDPQGPNQIITLTKEEEEYLSGSYTNDTGMCSIIIEEPITTTTESQVITLPGPITFPPKTPKPPVTTIPRPTFPGPICEQNVWDFCLSLESLCPNSRKHCEQQLCGSPQSFCKYLETAPIFYCKSDKNMTSFIDSLGCDKFCPNDMSFVYTGGNPPEKCQDTEDTIQESAVLFTAFTCQCDNGYKLSGKLCVPQEECGCNLEDGVYISKDTVLVKKNCTEKVLCVGNNILQEMAMQCSKRASCVKSQKGYQCQCDDGFYGEPEKQNGCQPPVTEDETKVCYRKESPEGVSLTTCNCKDGYISNCSTCIDLDECAENAHDCDLSKEKCENTIGSYVCTCAAGFEPVKGECKDIDECQLNLYNCGPHEGCINVPGSYECKCCAGYKYDLKYQKCMRDPSAVVILVSQPQCCSRCDYPGLCEASDINPEPFCFIGSGNLKEFPNYKALFEYYCVNNLYRPTERIQKGSCPDVAPTGSSFVPIQFYKPEVGGFQTTDGSFVGSDPVDQTPKPPSLWQKTVPRPGGCSDPAFCHIIPPPPPSLKEGPVCGPANAQNKQTFLSYCAMARSVCKSVGGPANLPMVAIAAENGPCPTIDPTLLNSDPQTKNSEETDPSSSPAPFDERDKDAPVKPLPPSEPLYTEWSRWTKCRVSNIAIKCGLGMQKRKRTTLEYDDDREVQPAKPDDLLEERVCFKPCDPSDPDFNKDMCDVDPGVCDEEKVCGSIGKGGPQTYDSECELNIEACKDGEKPFVVSKGDCDENNDDTPKQYCNKDGIFIEKKYKSSSANFTCIGDTIRVRTCSDLHCKGGFDNCCIATGYDKIFGAINCYDDNGKLVAIGDAIYVSATSCRCSHDADDEGGMDDVVTQKD